MLCEHIVYYCSALPNDDIVDDVDLRSYLIQEFGSLSYQFTYARLVQDLLVLTLWIILLTQTLQRLLFLRHLLQHLLIHLTLLVLCKILVVMIGVNLSDHLLLTVFDQRGLRILHFELLLLQLLFRHAWPTAFNLGFTPFRLCRRVDRVLWLSLLSLRGLGLAATRVFCGLLRFLGAVTLLPFEDVVEDAVMPAANRMHKKQAVVITLAASK